MELCILGYGRRQFAQKYCAPFWAGCGVIHVKPMNKLLVGALIFLMILALLAEIFLLGAVSGVSGVVCIFVSGLLCYKAAQLNKVWVFLSLAFVNILAVYLIAKPYEHRGFGTNECGLEFNEPHSHSIWDNGHLH